MTTQSFGSLAGWTQERGDWSVVSGGVKASADESGTDYHRWLLNNAAGTQNEDPSLRVKAWLGSASEDRRAFVIFSQGADWLGVAGFGHDAAMTVTSATASGGVRGEAGAILDAAKAVRRGAVALATFGADAYFDAFRETERARLNGPHVAPRFPPSGLDFHHRLSILPPCCRALWNRLWYASPSC